MKAGPKEEEFRETFSELEETAQDRLLEAARALSFAAETRSQKTQEELSQGHGGTERTES